MSKPMHSPLRPLLPFIMIMGCCHGPSPAPQLPAPQSRPAPKPVPVDAGQALEKLQRIAQACYDAELQERWLEGLLTVVLDVDADGAVEQVHASAAAFDASSIRACLAINLENWRFTAPGEPVSLEIPVQLTPVIEESP